MRFRIARASKSSPPHPRAVPLGDRYGQWAIEVGTLEELMALAREAGTSLIVDQPTEGPMGLGLPSITIYDDDIE